MPPTDVTTLIRTELPRLAGSLRKVGELILEDPAAVTHCSAAELGRRTGTSDLRAIQQTIDRVDLDAIERAAQALARARRIDVYGVGGSGAVAQETETRLFRIGCSVRGWTEVHAAATSAALLTPADVAIGISHSGATRETLEPFEMAKERGATTVALTTAPRSPLARTADIRLIS